MKKSSSSFHVATHSLKGKLLVAMPQMEDPRFARSVIYVCNHDQNGATGIVINKLTDSIGFHDLMAQLKINTTHAPSHVPIHFGGPVETGRGFVLHSDEYTGASTENFGNGLALTATIDVLKDIARQKGPKRFLLALGYAGWGGLQLDGEMQANGWLTMDANENLIFADDLDAKYPRAMQLMGLDFNRLAAYHGHA